MLVDELSLGLAPLLVKELMERLRDLRTKFGISILLIEQDAGSALAIADYGYIMEGGRIVYEGTADKLRSHQRRAGVLSRLRRLRPRQLS